MEVFAQSRGSLLPDPAFDEISCIFYAIHNNVPDEAMYLPQQCNGVIVNVATLTETNPLLERIGVNSEITLVQTEYALLMNFITLIRKWDPDIFVGYEIEMSSWGYLMQRGQAIDMNLVPLLSRVPTQKGDHLNKPKNEDQTVDDAFIDFEPEFKLCGRILLDVWRLMRSEINLTSYTFENIMYHVLHQRYPLYSNEKLTELWKKPVNRWIVQEYFLNRVLGTLEVLSQLDLIGRTCELAKLFGIQFYEVFSRGSQYRVESMMLR